jgi:proliferating cell nuclear antigen
MGIIFEAKTVQTANVKSLFEVLKDVLIELNLVITRDSIKIVSLSNREECLIHVKLDSSSFEYFHCDRTDENPLVLGIHTDNLFKIIKTIKHDETISFFVTDKDSERHSLFIKKENSERNSINTFKLQLHNIPRNNYIIEHRYNTTIVMSSNELQKICKDFSSLGNKVLEIKNIGEQIFFSGNGDFSSFELVVGNSQNTSFQNTVDKIVQGKFPTKYLLLFSKASILSTMVQMRLMNDFPLLMSYDVGNLGKMSFLVSCLTD